MAELRADIREIVRRRYARAAKAAAVGDYEPEARWEAKAGCCEPSRCGEAISEGMGFAALWPGGP